ncbi:sugar phosphate isomerase/epimerase family protein [Algoriphagus sp. SE2]|uniref:sugar phosphate isomerase/epimerase family protein n=1 Tax=Algoriphagus sp. SE2 TaxID=3141536 RepID=UPI0031CD245E
MIKSSTTIALVPQITYGPWIYWHDLEKGMEKASNLGFDAIELFTPASDSLEIAHLEQLLKKFNLELSAVGTGAGKVIHGLTLTDPDPEIREKAIAFISDMITFGAAFGAPAIIGSMQGNVLPGNDREKTLSWLADALEILGEKAAEAGSFLIYEPLNRYETNLMNTLKSGVELLEKLKTKQVKLLADLFHMNIEEADMAESIRSAGSHIGHIHFADSNRKPIGMGHTEMDSIASAIKEINYSHYISAEAFPEPNSDKAAEKTIESFKKYFR